jgi:hypothetical protein
MRAMGHGAIIRIASISALHGNPGHGAFKGGADPAEISGCRNGRGSLAAGFKA